jgi:selenocysteine-specific elongation factor
MTIVEPGTLTATQVIDCKLQLLASAKALKHRAPVHFHAWTAETEAEVRLLNGAERLKPGSEAIARLQLREPVLLVPGDRFIIRMFSPVETIGGGQVIDIQPPAKLRKALAHERAEALLAGSLAQRVERLVKEAGPGVELGQLAARLGVPVREIQPLVKAGPFLVAEGWVVAREWADKALAAIRSRLAQFHKAQPLQPGIAKEEIRTRELAGAPDRVVDLLLGSDKGIVVEGEAVRLASHTLRLKDDEAEATARVEQAFAQAGLAVPAVTEVLKTSGVEPARARALLQILFRQKRLVRVSEELVFHPDALAALRATLAARKGQRFGVGEFKEWTGVSRKYAIPLLEFLDRERVTRREGDQRIVN